MNNSIFKSFASKTIFVIDKKYSKSDYTKLTFRLSNEFLNKINVNHPKEMEEFINEFTKIKNAKVAIGGYLETRNLYKRSKYFNEQTTQVMNETFTLESIYGPKQEQSSGGIRWGNTQF